MLRCGFSCSGLGGSISAHGPQLPRTCATARPQLAKADTAFQGASIGQPTEPCLDAHRAALERAAAARGLSTAGFVEWLVGRALADAGLIEQPNPEGP